MNEPLSINALLNTEERRTVQLPTNLDGDGNPVCPNCGCNQSKVENSYPFQDGVKRRRRVCDYCDLPFHTLQPAEMPVQE